MNAPIRKLIADVNAAHTRDHTATADFEACKNPLCQLAYAAEIDLDTMQDELIALRTALETALGELQSTTENWREDCLFSCNDILTAALAKGGEA